jgi:hypothetical protein
MAGEIRDFFGEGPGFRNELTLGMGCSSTEFDRAV